MNEETELAACFVVIRGSLDDDWAEYIGDVTIRTQVVDDQTISTMLSGWVPDFAAFVGMIARLQNLGLPVQQISFHRLASHYSE